MTMSQQAIYDDGFDFRRAPQRDDRRIYVRANVSLPCGEIDPNTLRPIHSYRPGRVQAMQLDQQKRERELEKERSRKGVYIPLNVAVIAVAATMFLLGMLFLGQCGRVSEQQMSLNKLIASIKTCSDDIAELKDKITTASDEMTICYAASNDLEMVPANSQWITCHTVAAVSSRPASREQAASELQSVANSAGSARAAQ